MATATMERFWRATGVALGKHWKIVVVVVLITGVLAIGASRIEFATGQDSYLNPESQVALDNVEFQDGFGGETVIVMLTAQEGSGNTSVICSPAATWRLSSGSTPNWARSTQRRSRSSRLTHRSRSGSRCP